jgi:zinc D-Ala-D-Ala dipeptidase
MVTRSLIFFRSDTVSRVNLRFGLTMKPYQNIPIDDCGEPIVPIPADDFVLLTPHPYAVLGAPYGDRSPFFVRQGILDRLHQAAESLAIARPGWRILVFDAYRPIPVQQFMVDYSFQQLLDQRQLQRDRLTPTEQQHLLDEIYQFWAQPSSDPGTPPPHSTGAAIDLTLVNEAGTEINMGSPIDEMSPRSHPNYFANQTDSASVRYHSHRQLLQQIMTTAGFCQHPNEWWHFSWGDQSWVWQQGTEATARYGRYP